MPDLADAYLIQARTKRAEHWSGPPAMVDRIARTLRTRAEDVVVDVGCGIGGPARRLADVAGCRVVGVDVLEDVVRIGSRRRMRGVGFLAGDARRLPLRDGVADQVWSLGSAAHVPDIGAMAGEMHRVLKAGGRVAITEAFWEGRGEPRFAETAPRPWHAVTVSGLMSALAAAGFEDIRSLPWPGRGLAGSLDVDDQLLRRDLREGRLVPVLLVAEHP